MGFDELRDNIIEQGLTETETHLKILLEILVHESMQIGERGHTDVPNFIFSDSRFKSRFPVSSYRLEDSGFRRTFSRNKDYLLDNRLIETVPVNWPDDYKRRGTYYNTTPLGKVLAMKYWYNKFLGKKPLIIKTNEHIVPPEIWSKLSEDEKGRWQKDVPDGHRILDDGRLGIEIKPNDLLVSFFQFLPRLKKFSDDIKKAVRGLGPKEALQFTFPEIDINYSAPINRVAIEVKFRLKYQTHIQIIKYFKLDDREDVKKLYYYILDSLTYLFLANLEAMQKNLDVENPVIAKILNDPDLKSFRRQYQMDTKQVLQESLNFLSDDR